MPVNSTHPDYDATLPDWLRARDVLAGEDAIKSAGEKYLPALESQSEAEYAAYRQRASFFNATARTAEGYSGLIFRRPPFVKIPEPPGAMVRTLSPASLLPALRVANQRWGRWRRWVQRPYHQARGNRLR